ncbi:hypothetical protein, partial [Pseudomonas inefficax]|uniref:hypothetical protein n=1 Tax=Pseudomonas inefficax TaxID=2078786 RepID=UPI002DB64FF3
PGAIPVGAGAPAKNATQCMAPAVPMFTVQTPYTQMVHALKIEQSQLRPHKNTMPLQDQQPGCVTKQKNSPLSLR